MNVDSKAIRHFSLYSKTRDKNFILMITTSKSFKRTDLFDLFICIYKNEPVKHWSVMMW
jgi:hypothetical protein